MLWGYTSPSKLCSYLRNGSLPNPTTTIIEALRRGASMVDIFILLKVSIIPLYAVVMTYPDDLVCGKRVCSAEDTAI
ncbi:hypothetical protein BDQ12DRAFT_125621 [Crucibulum laeve]|uniref:Uncharacterized protein n=1 Tax=Crucibulum laeve TaxID=68775 RepID=A0A5C3LZS2_9AGAR|nr:hypothetical protein BDQ12DRAFT_125621 [Crucibulum laeve]